MEKKIEFGHQLREKQIDLNKKIDDAEDAIRVFNNSGNLNFVSGYVDKHIR
jgi:hypothetical protein